MKNIFEEIMSGKDEEINLDSLGNRNKVNSVELNALVNKDSQPESQISVIDKNDEEILKIKKGIKEDQDSLMPLDGRSKEAVKRVAELIKKKNLLEIEENKKKWQIKNN